MPVKQCHAISAKLQRNRRAIVNELWVMVMSRWYYYGYYYG
jgi:hypothetical protein